MRMMTLKIVLGALAAGACSSAATAQDAQTPPADAWQFRAVSAVDDVGPWRAGLAEALKDVDVPAPAAGWPTRWVTFAPWDGPVAEGAKSDDPTAFEQVPTEITLNGVSGCRATLGHYSRGVLDLTVGHGQPREDRWALCFGELEASARQDVVFEFRTDGPATLWIDGKQIAVAKTGGLHTAAHTLARGKHIVAARVGSGERRWTLSGAVRPAGKNPVIEARLRFDRPAIDTLASVLLACPQADTLVLNGRAVDAPVQGMLYDALPLAASRLRPKGNELVRTLSLAEARAEAAKPAAVSLTPVAAADARIHQGPVIAEATPATATIVAASTAHVPATLTIDGRALKSPTGLIHRWHVTGLKPGVAYDYTVAAGETQPKGGTLRTPPAAPQPATVAFVGDPQSGKPWQQVAAAVAKAQPDLLVIAGDLVRDGLRDDQWTQQFFEPAATLLANAPVAVVPGNHDRYAPLMDVFFGGAAAPAEAASRNWTRQVGGALLIGIDGGLDWRADGPNARWLSRTLAASKHPFVFVVTHYPAYSSRNHGKLAADGAVLEYTSRVARGRIVPILEAHGVTAMLAGHDHGYERSQTAGGLTTITVAGGGAGVYPKRDTAEQQNPRSKAMADEHHYGLLRIDGGKAVFTAITPDGKVIDTQTWGPRDTRKSEG